MVLCYNEIMSDTIISVIITGFVTLTVNLIANWSSRKKDAIANAVRDQQIEDKLQALAERVDQHNGLADKIVSIEKAIVRIDTKLENKKG